MYGEQPGPGDSALYRAELNRLRAENTRLRLARELAERTARGAPLAETVELALTRLHDIYPELRVAFGLIEGRSLLRVQLSRQPAGMADLTGHATDLKIAPAYLARLREGEAFRVEDVQREPVLAPLAALLESAGTHALVVVPVWFSGDLLGLLCVDAPAPSPFLPDTVDLLEGVANQLAIARAHTLRDAARSESAASAALNARRLEVLLRSLEGGVLVESEHRRIVLANPSLCALFGIRAPPEALVGADCDAAADQAKALFSDPEGFVHRVAEILRARTPVTGEELQLVDGRVLERDYVPVELDTVPRGHMWHYRDVTARHTMVRRLEQVAASRAQLLANMSHEIRTPMNGVTGMLELLGTYPLDAEARDCVRVARSSAKTLLTLIDDILDLSKVESGRLELESAPLSVVRLANEVLAAFGAGARAKGVELRLEATEVHAPHRIGDQLRLRQVLANLVGNAIKFTDEGAVTVRLREEGDDRVRFEVEDTGAGIAPERLETVFDEFEQAGPSTQRYHGGTGLGLAICRRLAGVMGGSIGVTSEVGNGSKFTFTVPLEVSQTPSVTEDLLAPSSEVATEHDHRVLLVEDNPVNQRVAQRMLERLGCTVTVASDGAEGHRRALEGAYDVVLMDCRMPIMDGFEAARRIRSSLGDNAPPIVALSANAYPEDRARSLDAGMVDHLSKPVSLAALGRVLTQIEGQLARSLR